MTSVIYFNLILSIFCGLVSTQPSNVAEIDDRIVGGNSVAITDRKYQIALIGPGYYCGGSLIKWDWVLTAAHCLADVTPNQISVRAGSEHWNSGGVTKNAKKVISHPKYKSSTNTFDVGLVQVISEFPKQDNINVIPLIEKLPSDGEWLSVSGYGDLYTDGPPSANLQVVWVKKINFNTCNQKYSNVLTQTMFCAALTGKDSCQGDSGGPIVYQGKLAGVVSWGYGCADSRYPGIYTSVPFVRPWIISNSQ